MRQILQHLGSGQVELAEVPVPQAPGHGVLVRTSRTLVSAGTERMLVDFGRANWVQKARQQPDKVRMVLDKVRTDGLVPTLEAVRNKLDQPLAMGYCNVGRVVAAGAGVTGLSEGMRVVSNGKHAEYVAVPALLCATIPDAVTDEAAAFTVLGAIALQGMRLAQPTLGETVVVTGLGLIGLLTVQLLRAHGCRVIGMDFDAERLALARQFGAHVIDLAAGEDPVQSALESTKGRGADAVLITASTASNAPIQHAARMSRKRGRIVLVGVTGLELSRADFYEKELTFQVSCSYGPGRYDATYEDKGQDYPVGFVRWTAQRNFEAVLHMLGDGRLDVSPLISHRFPIERAADAYNVVGGKEPSLGIILEYPEPAPEPAALGALRTVALAGPATSPATIPATGRGPRCSVIGAGNYAGAVLLPAFAKAGASFQRIVSSGGVTSVHLGRKHGFALASTDAADALADPHTDAVIVATRHDSHADYAVRALHAGKHVFVEKPLALRHDELERVATAAQSTDRLLMVGFNRRFAPQVRRMGTLLRGVPGPKTFIMTVNAGAIPLQHWTQDPGVGGGRLLGEACHFVDLLRHLAGSPIVRHDVLALNAVPRDTFTITLGFADGSLGTVVYAANGHRGFPKERLEVFAGGRVLQLDNFRRLTGFGWPQFRAMRLWRQDKGQVACARAFCDAIRHGGSRPIPLDELLEVGRVTIALAGQLA